MSIRLYDTALVNKLKKWTADPHAVVTAPEETRRLFEWKADTTNDRPIDLPLIALRRGRDINFQSFLKQPRTFDGPYLETTDNRIMSLSSIPVNISY